MSSNGSVILIFIASETSSHYKKEKEKKGTLLNFIPLRECS